MSDDDLATEDEPEASESEESDASGSEEPSIAEVDQPSVDRADPFDDLDAGVEDPFADLDAEFDPDEDPFEEMSVDGVDGADLWEALDEADGPEANSVAATPVEGADGREDHIVDKREYCQRCPNFTDPPEVGCTLDDVDIVAVVNSDEFRVRGCPMISEEGPQFDSTS